MAGESNRYQAQAGQWFFPRPGTRHQAFSPGTRLLSICFRLRWPSGLNVFSKGLPWALGASSAPALTRVARELVAAVKPAYEQAYPDGGIPHRGPSLDGVTLTLNNYMDWSRHFENWLATFTSTLTEHGIEPQGADPIDPRVIHALAWLRSESREGRFSETELASEVGLSSSHLDRLFSQSMGQTPRGYYNTCRLQRINHALAYTQEPIKSIAFRHGFKSVSHFSHWYRGLTSLSPRSYRQDPVLHTDI